MRSELIDTQRRGRKIALSGDEVDALLTEQRVCHVATLTAGGTPHVSPLWFVWDGTSLWLYSIVRSQRWADLLRDGRAAVVVDAGGDFGELHGVELRGRFEPVGETPRTGQTDVPELAAPERLFAAKYIANPDGSMYHDGRHAWLRLTPEKAASWDHRKLGF
ncbi:MULTISPECIES: pyridoxamine 5'-phosphate oxidase family protein [unclassified Pseudofrankia]|uniref:pyridoxamine 5'-phosphate oxidase family protein n=1 Tax=unclassified Pseudofrankia TaxID=2994372 RepID=UPI0008D9E68C|nr:MULTISPECIES: pyridoxamine 5'-phosphate oxidase family protein [unclassified Pseudofrankia]MDT3440659.1 pyridoxamine 5'-phosphate oxidase family protein [Pseudofrankia sp. BMG5.37]OHV60585.1 pyridoxamine 5-phosphate oxidase [Pseudofrankia sp. BMG5.36]